MNRTIPKDKIIKLIEILFPSAKINCLDLARGDHTEGSDKDEKNN